MTEEIQADVANEYASARRDIEPKINSRIDSADYGSGLAKWYFIGIVRKIDRPEYGELQKYIKSKKEVEFRKRIDYLTFKAANAFDQRKLIFESLVESVRLMPKIGVPNFNHQRLLDDLLDLARNEGWLEKTQTNSATNGWH